jgi:hypothetical protein
LLSLQIKASSYILMFVRITLFDYDANHSLWHIQQCYKWIKEISGVRNNINVHVYASRACAIF